MASWYNAGSAREEWVDAEAIEHFTLETLLEVAREQVIAYAPALPADLDVFEIPTRYAYAQLRQAQNLWNAGRVDAGGSIGDGGDFVMPQRPLDWHVKAILRPAGGRPRVR
jgi:hypothetical protein